MLAARKDIEMEAVQYENRLARLEVGVEHMGSDISEIKVQLHDLRTSMDARFEVVNQRFEAVNQKFETLNQRFDQRFDAINDRFADTNEKIEAAVQRFEKKMDVKLAQHDQRFETLLIAFGDKHAQLIEKMGEIKVWTLTVVGGGLGFGILGVLARALHWV